MQTGAHDLPVTSLRDLAVSKLTVIQQRAGKKGYHDLHARIHQADMTLEAMLVDAHEAHGTRHTPIAALQALARFDDGDVQTLPEAIMPPTCNRAWFSSSLSQPDALGAQPQCRAPQGDTS
ncbi:hypothetical protein [Chachezhania sediminis]|uniref:hypothetical protein n=1 Tax=Chachezhania sediminis TaxID=2599291 RepID=UPI00131CE4B7|nr:hypothetical protein [Chachezhania sediminis]